MRLTAALILLALPASAQEGEIFIPGGNAAPQPVQQAPQARSALARCLANPDATTCAGASVSAVTRPASMCMSPGARISR